MVPLHDQRQLYTMVKLSGGGGPIIDNSTFPTKYLNIIALIKIVKIVNKV